jgi:hypothetical protein
MTVGHGLFPPRMAAMALVGLGKSADRIDFAPCLSGPRLSGPRIVNRRSCQAHGFNAH